MIECGAKIQGISRTKPKYKNNNFFFSKVDINSFEEVKLFKKNELKFIKLDFIVNTVGISKDYDDFSNSIESFEQIVKTNLISIYNLINCLKPNIKKHGSIVNVTSIGGHLGFPNNPGYLSSKSGLRNLTKSLSIDLYNYNSIRVNNVAPGYILTDMTKKSFDNIKRRKKICEKTSLNRWESQKK